MLNSIGQAIRSDRQEATVSSGSPLGLVPLMLAMPLMYWPRILEGDTQPWVTIGGAFAVLFFWPQQRSSNTLRVFVPLATAAVCGLVYALRETNAQSILRYVGIMATFSALWIVACRGGADLVTKSVRFTIVLWFIVGLGQMVFVRLGISFEFVGRFVLMRSGVPSLTAEPSFYGSLSVLQLMYLSAQRKRENIPYLAMATVSVLLSGSILSYLLLIVPVMRLPTRYKVLGVLAVFVVFLQGLNVADSALFARISNLQSVTALSDFENLLERDASTNLRVGHVIFTLNDNLERSLFLNNGVSFRDDYNDWAFSGGRFLYNESDFILTSAGEMVFRSGPFGFILVIMMIIYGVSSTATWQSKIEKGIILILCFLSPIALSNPFFIFYIAQRGSR
jgi:hypothetical protein